MKMTALHAAALGNDAETVRVLVDAGLDVNASDFQGFTPLIYAASNVNLAAARLLLAKGADVNAVSGDGAFQKVKAGTLAQGYFTPLIMAAPFGSTRTGEGAARRRRERQRAGYPRHDAADARGRDRSSERRTSFAR